MAHDLTVKRDFMKERIAKNINVLSRFLGMRDVPSLTKQAFQQKYGIEQADLMVLFGGSILKGADVLARVIQNDAARKYIIVGGAGHTTETLRQVVHGNYPKIETAGQSEAQIFQAVLESVYHVKADYLECQSTNCGNNITFLLDLIRENNLPFDSIILVQDAAMQRRMDAGLRKYVSDPLIINYAAYQVDVSVDNDQLVYTENIPGMWQMDRFITLLMGEIPRLSDDAQGYGPNGQGFIAHVEIPEDVSKAFEELKEAGISTVRTANPAFASTNSL